MIELGTQFWIMDKDSGDDRYRNRVQYVIQIMGI